LELDDVLDIVAVVIWILSVVAGVIVVVNNFRFRRLIRELRANPEFKAQVEEILKDQAAKDKTEA